MDETMTNAVTTEEVDGQLSFEEENAPKTESANDELTTAIEAQLEKIRLRNLLLGSQSMGNVILQKIVVFKNKQGKPTMNDYKRLIKDIQQCCETAISRKVNADGTTTPVEKSTETETVQN